MMNAWLKIGLLQPVIDSNKCWGKEAPFRLNIFSYAAERVWQEIKEGLRMMLSSTDKPDIILIPELHLPPNRVADIKSISKANNIVIIAGVDFQRHPLEKNKIRNRGIITLPDKWGKGGRSNRLSTLYVGKTYFTYMERDMFKDIEGEQCFEDPEKNMYVFQSEIFGRFGIMICSDIFDIERMMLYQGMIHHLFIISLNKDLNTYFAMTEALSRLLYCNIVLCNTGFFGGSVAISPYRDPNERIIYKYQGQRMFNTNIISIPVSSLDSAQKLDYSIPDEEKIFKASPPGYHDKIAQLRPGMPGI